MDSPLEAELSAVVAPLHGTRNVTIQYGPTAHSDYRFRAHKHVLWAVSAKFQRQFESKEYVSWYNPQSSSPPLQIRAT